MNKVEALALIIVLLITIGAPLCIYYYEFEYRPTILGLKGPGVTVRTFIINVASWNLTEAVVNRGDVVKLVLVNAQPGGFYVEHYTEKQAIINTVTVQFVADTQGSFPIMLAVLVFECHCWVTSPYKEMGRLIVQEG